MTIGVQKSFIDFTQVGGDTGQNDADSILPYADGELVNQAVLNRSIEQLRKRTERIRDVLDDSLYLRDADRRMVLAGPGVFSWNGPAPGADGIPTLSDNLYLVPFLTPGLATNTPPIASSYGSLTLTKQGGGAGIIVTSRRRNYEGGHKFNVTVQAGSTTSAVLQGSPPRNAVITAASGAILDTVINAINALTDEQGTQALTASLAPGAGLGDLINRTQAQQFVQGNWDAEGHVLTPAALTAFFATATNVLREGDTLAVWYAALTEDATNPSAFGPLGGRRQSIPENANTTIPEGSLFNSRVHPERLANALPIAKVIAGRLILLNGGEVYGVTSDDGPSRIHALAAGVFMATGTLRAQLNALDTALNAVVNNGALEDWADGTANPAATTVAQLAKVIHDLGNSGVDGATRIHGAASGHFMSAGTLRAQLNALDANIYGLGVRAAGAVRYDAGTDTYSYDWVVGISGSPSHPTTGVVNMNLVDPPVLTHACMLITPNKVPGGNLVMLTQGLVGTDAAQAQLYNLSGAPTDGSFYFAVFGG